MNTTKMTKIDKFNKIIDLLLSMGEEADVDESIAFINKEIELVENKRANDKLRKQKAQKDDYAPLIDETIKKFLLKDDGVLGNDDLVGGMFEDVSISKKTQIFAKLIASKKVEKLPKAKTKDKQLYKWVVKTPQTEQTESDTADIVE